MTAEAAERSYPVPPDCVYVWRGFRAPNTTQDLFANFLGSTFVPACALLQPAVGLRAYVSCLVPQTTNPAAVPDQTALMFWAEPGAHDLATRSLAVRIYQNLHGGTYDMTRSHTTEVPIALPTAGGALTADQPYHLLDGAIACVGADYVVYWELTPSAPGEQQAPSGIPIIQAVCTDWSHVFTPAPTFVPVGLWDEWSGMDVVAGSSLNMQFARRSTA